MISARVIYDFVEVAGCLRARVEEVNLCRVESSELGYLWRKIGPKLTFEGINAV